MGVAIAILLVVSYKARLGEGNYAHPSEDDFDWSSVVKDGKLTIRMTTWNTFMIPITYAKLNGLFFSPQGSRSEKVAKFLAENEVLRNSHVLLLQEVWSPGTDFLTNAMSGFFKMFGKPVFGRARILKALKEQGFHYMTRPGQAGYLSKAFMPWHGLFDSGCLLASKIPFKNERYTKYPWQTYDDMLASKGIHSVEIPVKSGDGKPLGSLVVGNTHMENAWVRDARHEHFQLATARKHMSDHVQARTDTGKCSCTVSGDWNLERMATDLNPTKTPSKYTLTQGMFTFAELPPVPAKVTETSDATTEENIKKFLGGKPTLQKTTEEVNGEQIDITFVLDLGAPVAKAEVSKAQRLDLTFKDSTPEQKATENVLSWIDRWNNFWKTQPDGVDRAMEVAKNHAFTIISDHFPVSSELSVDFN